MTEDFCTDDYDEFENDFDNDGEGWCGDCGKCEDCLDTLTSECGKMLDGSCSLAGTEHCDWDCPFSGDDDEDDDEESFETILDAGRN